MAVVPAVCAGMGRGLRQVRVHANYAHPMRQRCTIRHPCRDMEGKPCTTKSPWWISALHFAGDAAACLRTGRRIDGICTEIGFFTITGHATFVVILATC